MKNTETAAEMAVRLIERVSLLEGALSAIVKHWRDGEPIHGQAIEDLMDRAEAALRQK